MPWTYWRLTKDGRVCIIPQIDTPGLWLKSQYHIDFGVSPGKQHNLKVEHVTGEDNQETGRLSRLYQPDWHRVPNGCSPGPGLIHIYYVNKHLGLLKRDLFASPWNAQLAKFSSWELSHHQINAFQHQWMGGNYAFPPFTLAGKVLRKIWRYQCSVILIALRWKTQSWFPTLPGDALQEPCSTADPQRSDARPREQPSSSVISANQTAWPSQGMLPKWWPIKRKLWSEFWSNRGFDHNPEQIDLIHLAEFLFTQIYCGVSITMINAYTSALSAFCLNLQWAAFVTTAQSRSSKLELWNLARIERGLNTHGTWIQWLCGKGHP